MQFYTISSYCNILCFLKFEVAAHIVVSSASFCFHFEIFFTMPIRIDVGPSLIVFIIILHYYPLTIAYNCNYTNHTPSTQHNILYSILNSLDVGTYNNTHMNGHRRNVRYFTPVYDGIV